MRTVANGSPLTRVLRRRAEPEPLAFLVAKHLLESQGAQVSLDGRVARVDLRCIAPEGPARPTHPTEGTESPRPPSSFEG